MEGRLVELSRTIDKRDLGRRIRNARIAVGLTQTELAADDVTSGYISRIEDGQRRPDFALLGRLAARMRTTLEDLLDEAASPARLELLVALDHAELALAGGDPRTALTEADRLIAEIGPQGSGDLLRRCQLIRAGALEAIGELNQAIIQLEDLCASPTATPEWLRSLVALTRCHREIGDLERAIAVGQEAESKIAELELAGLTESIQLSVTVASAYMLRGDLDAAMRLCMRAIEQAEAVSSPIAKASALWNASLIESRRGANEAALELARKALTYFEMGEDSRNLARLRGHVADMLLEQQPPDAEGALSTLTTSLAELEWSSASAVDRASHLQTRARAHLLRGENSEAMDDVRESLRLVPQEATMERAFGHSILGQVEMANGNVDEARQAFLAAVHLLSAAGADREAAQLWLDLGVRLREVGEPEAALDAFQRAAVSSGLKAPTAALATADRE